MTSKLDIFNGGTQIFSQIFYVFLLYTYLPVCRFVKGSVCQHCATVFRLVQIKSVLFLCFDLCSERWRSPLVLDFCLSQQQGQGAVAQQVQATLQGQTISFQPQPAAAPATLQPQQQLQQQGEQPSPALTLPTSVVGLPQVKVDVKPPSATVLQIQPKSNAKLRMVSPKLEPGAPSSGSLPAGLQDTKPVLVAGGAGAAAAANLISGLPQGPSHQITTGNVIMTMSSPLVAPGQAGASQPQMLRIQIAGQKPQALGVTAAAAAVTTTATQQVVVQSPQKVRRSPPLI